MVFAIVQDEDELPDGDVSLFFEQLKKATEIIVEQMRILLNVFIICECLLMFAQTYPTYYCRETRFRQATF